MGGYNTPMNGGRVRGGGAALSCGVGRRIVVGGVGGWRYGLGLLVWCGLVWVVEILSRKLAPGLEKILPYAAA